MNIEITGSDLSDILSRISKPDYILDESGGNQIRLSTPSAMVNFKEEILHKDLSIFEANYLMKDNVQLFGKGESDLLEIHFNLSKKDIFYQGKSKTQQVAPSMSGNISYLSGDENQADIYFQKDTHYHTFDIHLPMSLLDQYAGESKKLDNFLAQIHHGASSKLSPAIINITPAIYNCIQDIKECKYEGLTRRIYLESKAYEIIALLYEDSNKRSAATSLGSHDMGSIQLAASIIRDNLDEPLTIPQLARMAGINQTKLKTGFKTVFGTTVFGYQQDIRMHQAKKYLLDTQLSIREIGLRLGYENTANFSNAFKKILGYSPMKFRKN